MFRFRTLLIGITALFFITLSGAAQESAVQKFPMEQQKLGVTVRLTKARWATPEEVHYPHLGKDQGWRVLAVDYEIERSDAGKDDVSSSRFQLFADQFETAINGTLRVQGALTRGQWIFTQVDPRASRIDLELEVQRPNAPPAANGTSEEILDFGVVSVPEWGDAVLEIHQQQKTALGTIVEIESARWQKFQTVSEKTNERGEKTSVVSDGRQLVFTTRSTPPSTPDTAVAVSLGHGFVTDDSGKSINPPQFHYGSSIFSQPGIPQERTKQNYTDLDATRNMTPPETPLKEVHLKIRVRENAPARRLPEWSPIFRFALNPSALPAVISSSEPPPPLAQSEFPGGVIELESIQPDGVIPSDLRRIRLRTRSVFSAGKNIPSWVWTPHIQEARDDTGSEWVFNFNTEPVYFHADGAPLRAGEYGGGVSFRAGSTPGTKAAAKTLDLKLRLSAHRVVGPMNFENIPVPRNPGEILPLRQVQVHPSGAKLILWKIGAFDKTHPTALTAPGRTQSSDAGIALVFEYRPIPDGAKIDRVALGERIVRDENDVILPLGVRFGNDENEMKFPMSNGDLLKAGVEDGEWISIFLPTPPAETKTLKVTMQILERQLPNSGPIIEWKAIPLASN